MAWHWNSSRYSPSMNRFVLKKEVSIMSAAVERLVSRYEGGKMTRRDLVRALSALVVASGATPKAQPSRIPVRALDHVTLMVSDTDRSVAFYQRVFEMPVMSRLGPTVNLAAGSSCLGL